jgi:hypothetical protein
MVKALEEQKAISDFDSLSFDKRLGLLIDSEMTTRENQRLDTHSSESLNSARIPLLNTLNIIIILTESLINS